MNVTEMRLRFVVGIVAIAVEHEFGARSVRWRMLL